MTLEDFGIAHSNTSRMRNPGVNGQRELVSFGGATAVMRGDAWIVLW